MKKRNRRKGTSAPPRARRTRFEALEQRQLLSTTPTLSPIADVTLYKGTTINLPLDAIYDLDTPLTYSATCSDPNLSLYVPEGNRSMRMSVSAENGAITGDMVFELFDQRAPRATHQITSLAENGFYDGLIFHRIINGFMIQGGDPTGTGSGGSYLGDFNDQFHTELMHTYSGVLSMAKSTDDTNDSQFFITEVPTRYLDFQHSVIGQLIEGDDIREALSNVDTDGNDRPDNDVVMESVEIFVDHENAVLVITAPNDYAGSSEVTITVTIDDGGTEYVQTPINVTIEDDIYYDSQQQTWFEQDSNPFLTDLPVMRTTVDTPCEFDLSPYVQDADGGDGDELYYFDDDALIYFMNQYPGYEEYIPYLDDPSLGYSPFTSEENESFATGVIEFTPTDGIVGTYPFTIGVATYLGYLDKQVAALNIVPENAPDASIAMTLVTDPTAVDAQGEVASLPDDATWINTWEDCSVEVWAKIDDPGQFGIYSVETDLNFDPDQYQVANIEWGVGFSQEQTGEYDNTTGTITGLGGTTKWYTAIPYAETIGYAQGAADAYPSSGAEDLIMWGDDQYVLVARVDFEPVVNSAAMTVQPGIGYNPAITPGFSLSGGDVKWNAEDGTDVTVDTAVDTEIWAIPYDLVPDGVINLLDVGSFLARFKVDLDSTPWGYACDFDRNGIVDLADFSDMLALYGYRADVGLPIQFPDNYPPAPAAASAALMGTQSASLMGTLSASDLAQHGNEDDDDDQNEAGAVDLLMALYADAD